MKITFSPVDVAISEKLDSFFPKKNRFIEINPGRIYLPKKFVELSDEILNLPVRKDDVWVVSYPRSGSTWAQELVWLLGSKLDFEGAKKTVQLLRAPLLELTALFSEDNYQWVEDTMGDSVECVRNFPSPRFPRSHLPQHLLPYGIDEVKPKLIYTARNPKDLCVSYYHHCKLVHNLNGPFDKFCELFISENAPIGSYWGHVLPFWERRNDPNILFLKYEDMKRDLPATIRKCADFLELDYELTATDIDQIQNHLNFDYMKQNSAVNFKPIVRQEDAPQSNARFIRKGQVGDWKNHITPEISRKFDEWTDRKTRGTGLFFDYE